MKKHNLHYTAAARRDLDDIYDHIAAELSSPIAAGTTIDRIMDEVDRLETFAEIGPLLSSIADVDDTYRFLVSGSYMIFYRVDGENIYIDRILYGRRDYLRLFDPPNA